ncbi:MAG: hypothetical protein ABI782_04865 [Anaerolineaceae bacterium]
MTPSAGINLANELQDIFQRINRIAGDLSPEVGAALEAQSKRVFQVKATLMAIVDEERR